MAASCRREDKKRQAQLLHDLHPTRRAVQTQTHSYVVGMLVIMLIHKLLLLLFIVVYILLLFLLLLLPLLLLFFVVVAPVVVVVVVDIYSSCCCMSLCMPIHLRCTLLHSLATVVARLPAGSCNMRTPPNGKLSATFSIIAAL